MLIDTFFIMSVDREYVKLLEREPNPKIKYYVLVLLRRRLHKHGNEINPNTVLDYFIDHPELGVVMLYPYKHSYSSDDVMFSFDTRNGVESSFLKSPMKYSLDSNFVFGVPVSRWSTIKRYLDRVFPYYRLHPAGQQEYVGTPVEYNISRRGGLPQEFSDYDDFEPGGVNPPRPEISSDWDEADWDSQSNAEDPWNKYIKHRDTKGSGRLRGGVQVEYDVDIGKEGSPAHTPPSSPPLTSALIGVDADEGDDESPIPLPLPLPPPIPLPPPPPPPVDDEEKKRRYELLQDRLANEAYEKMFTTEERHADFMKKAEKRLRRNGVGTFDLSRLDTDEFYLPPRKKEEYDDSIIPITEFERINRLSAIEYKAFHGMPLNQSETDLLWSLGFTRNADGKWKEANYMWGVPPVAVNTDLVIKPRLSIALRNSDNKLIPKDDVGDLIVDVKPVFTQQHVRDDQLYDECDKDKRKYHYAEAPISVDVLASELYKKFPDVPFKDFRDWVSNEKNVEHGSIAPINQLWYMALDAANRKMKQPLQRFMSLEPIALIPLGDHRWPKNPKILSDPNFRVILSYGIYTSTLETAKNLDADIGPIDYNDAGGHQIVLLVYPNTNEVKVIDSSLWVTDYDSFANVIRSPLYGSENYKPHVNYIKRTLRRLKILSPQGDKLNPALKVTFPLNEYAQQSRYFFLGDCTTFTEWYGLWYLYNYLDRHQPPPIPRLNPIEMRRYMARALLDNELLEDYNLIPPELRD